MASSAKAKYNQSRGGINCMSERQGHEWPLGILKIMGTIID